ncbi:MAG: UDP-N-acetylglucosamine 2-epimerase (non-hydrolyzing) [Coriobacteriia bacterium]|nr:UDP-N-acetylglucosamine 2-epimerase (non-hydrolyzing) [Coriobacteriia bacterium]
MARKVLSIFGTRPEAIKMAPVVRALARDERFDAKVLVTAQHRAMLDQVLNFFEIVPDFDLDIMEHGQTLAQITARVLEGVTQVLDEWTPDVIVVHGDTTTTFAAALAAFYRHVDVAHIEAGMRTGDLHQPFPEELNRTLVARMARYSFAPSAECEGHLLREGIAPERIIRTAHNTGVDALLLARDMLADDLASELAEAHDKHILVTAHRRESWGESMRNIFGAVADIASAHPDYHISVATHANPLVADDATAILDGISNVELLPPQSYRDFVTRMARSRVILSDSGGIQEEGPTLGVPVVVMRNKTEYHELLDAGVVFLGGTQRASIVETTERILADEAIHAHVRQFACDRATQSSIPQILDTLAADISDTQTLDTQAGA